MTLCRVHTSSALRTDVLPPEMTAWDGILERSPIDNLDMNEHTVSAVNSTPAETPGMTACEDIPRPSAECIAALSLSFAPARAAFFFYLRSLGSTSGLPPVTSAACDEKRRLRREAVDQVRV